MDKLELLKADILLMLHMEMNNHREMTETDAKLFLPLMQVSTGKMMAYEEIVKTINTLLKENEGKNET